MEAFRPWRGGYLSKAQETERRLLARMACDVVEMLGYSMADLAERESSDAAEADPLAVYEAELSGVADGYASSGRADPELADSGRAGGRRPIDDAMFRLLPDMSEDPRQAEALRELTSASLSAAKAEHLFILWRSVNGATDDVWVGNEDMPGWISAINSIRLVLASRLDIQGEEDGREIYEAAQDITGANGKGNQREVQTPDELLRVLYTMVTWWQESLLLAARNKTPHR